MGERVRHRQKQRYGQGTPLIAKYATKAGHGAQEVRKQWKVKQGQAKRSWTEAG